MKHLFFICLSLFFPPHFHQSAIVSKGKYTINDLKQRLEINTPTPPASPNMPGLILQTKQTRMCSGIKQSELVRFCSNFQTLWSENRK